MSLFRSILILCFFISLNVLGAPMIQTLAEVRAEPSDKNASQYRIVSYKILSDGYRKCYGISDLNSNERLLLSLVAYDESNPGSLILLSGAVHFPCKKGVLPEEPDAYGYKPSEAIVQLVNQYGGLGNWNTSHNQPYDKFFKGKNICIFENHDEFDGHRDAYDCTTTPIANNESCSVGGGVTIDHGNVSSSAVNNHKASVLVNVNCTGTTDVNMKIGPSVYEPSGKISLGSGITSEFSIDSSVVDSSGFDTNLQSGSNTINIESTLKVSGKPEAGAFSGQGVLYINTQ